MEENKDKIVISCGDFLTLSKVMSSQEVKYTRLEMHHEMLKVENERLKQRLEESESARKKAESETKIYIEENQRQREEMELLKAHIEELQNYSKLSKREQLENAAALLLEHNVLLSYLKMRAFMQTHVKDLNTAMMLRGFVEDCISDELRTSAIGMVGKVMLLPEVPKPQLPVNYDQRHITLTGNDATYNENPKE